VRLGSEPGPDEGPPHEFGVVLSAAARGGVWAVWQLQSVTANSRVAWLHWGICALRGRSRLILVLDSVCVIRANNLLAAE
jgi:hypothetical protein